MRKRVFILLSFILLIAIICVPIVVNANGIAASVTLADNTGKSVYNPGDEIKVEVKLSDLKAGAETLGAYVSTDSSKLELVDIDGEIASVFEKGLDDMSNSVIILKSTNKKGKTLNEGTLGTITYKVKLGAEGIAKIYFGNVVLTNLDESEKFDVTKKELVINIENKSDENTFPFIDVKSNDWFYDAVKFVWEKNLFKGITGTEFGPNMSITRGMFVTVLYRYEGVNDTETSTYDDVDKYMYYSAPIAWATKKGVVKGIGDNKFAPERQISREELATIMVRYINSNKINIKAEDEYAEKYDDFNQIADYAKENVMTLRKLGLMKGKTANGFDPKGKTTRAEVATLLMRFIQKISK